MKLLMTLLVRDEADVVAANIDYHLARGVSHVIATDHRSVDGTTDILRGYERAGVLSLLREDDEAFEQDAWVTRMATIAVERFAADWIFHVDADEFWWPEWAQDLCEAFAALPDEAAAVAVARHNFVPVADVRGAQPFHQVMRHRQRRSTNPLGAPLPGKVAHRGLPGVAVLPGNHGLWIEGRPCVLAETGTLSVFHFPMRSVQAYLRKIRAGAEALARVSRYPEAVGRTWRELYRLDRDGGLQAHLERQLHDDATLAGAESRGELLLDERLAGFMAALAVDGNARAEVAHA